MSIDSLFTLIVVSFEGRALETVGETFGIVLLLFDGGCWVVDLAEFLSRI